MGIGTVRAVSRWYDGRSPRAEVDVCVGGGITPSGGAKTSPSAGPSETCHRHSSLNRHTHPLRAQAVAGTADLPHWDLWHVLRRSGPAAATCRAIEREGTPDKCAQNCSGPASYRNCGPTSGYPIDAGLFQNDDFRTSRLEPGDGVTTTDTEKHHVASGRLCIEPGSLGGSVDWRCQGRARPWNSD